MNTDQSLKAAIWLATATLLSVAVAQAETITLKADLKGSNEVPPNNSPASGTAQATLDTASKLLTYTITYKDLTGPALRHYSRRRLQSRLTANRLLRCSTCKVYGQLRPGVDAQLEHVGPTVVADRIKIVQSFRSDPNLDRRNNNPFLIPKRTS
jgi:hypothetical protein